MRLLIAVSILALMTANGAAKEQIPKPMQAALNKFVDEALYCVAYFGFTQESVRRRPDASSEKSKTLFIRVGQLADKSLDLAFTTGQQIDLSKDGLSARQKLVFADVKKITNNSMANLPILVAKYDKPCKRLTKTPEKRVQELFAKEFK